MTDIFTLKTDVETDGLVQSAEAMERLADAAERVSDALQRLNGRPHGGISFVSAGDFSKLTVAPCDVRSAP